MLNDIAPEYLLFAQHGWADTGNTIGSLLRTAVSNQTKVIAPSLGLLKTFIRLQPLVEHLEQIAIEEINNHPDLPLKIVGHSMGGLMWLEVLERNPQWWQQVHSLILLGSPIGGSNIARIIDPWGMGIGTARDLGHNRRSLAAKIAQKIPTLSVASDIGMGTDGLVTVENTKFDYANWQLTLGIPHSAMRYHPRMVSIMQNFWANPQLGMPPAASLEQELIQRLRSVSGMTDADYGNFGRSHIVANFAGQLTLRTWTSLWGIKYVYLGKQQQCIYSGYVGLSQFPDLRQELKAIQQWAL